MLKGTSITYRGGKPNPEKDNRAILKDKKRNEPLTDEEFKRSFYDKRDCFMHVTDDTVYAYCKLKYKKHPFILLEPNPVTFDYSVAFDVTRQLFECHSWLSQSLNGLNTVREKSTKLAVSYSYVFKVTSIGVIFSFLCLEAFLNQQLPEYEKVLFKGKLHSKAHIERYFSFDDKLEIVMALSGKNFSVEHPAKRKKLAVLKELRHMLTHVKALEGSGLTRYEYLYNNILKCNLKSLVSTVKFFINYHYPGLIRNYHKPKMK